MRLLPPHWSRSYDASLARRAEAARQRQLMRAFYEPFIRAGELCFDVGANMGNRTAVLLGLGARVVCIEPQPACLTKLRKSFGKNPAVTIVAKALGAEEGQGELAVCEQEPTLSTLSDKWRREGRFAKTNEWTKTVPIEITTLNHLIALYGRPVFCKIDVEGFEASVLRGLTTPIPFISFEFTREFLADAQTCVEHLLSLGPAVFNVSLAESMTPLWKDWVDGDALYKSLEDIKDASLWGDIYCCFPPEATGP